ncbi:hypothetical protein KIN20_019244 [Parelaphostrongylus tenuis]|uniref:Uncharacterized protein n=1 Tax=Parelaphostrongylus tenuis TaxID=148309 RepID=A0AAD5QSP7_PARTN|nr:hypothetical protein KIN20_019244 [Parelaphostrongylus tenuis]
MHNIAGHLNEMGYRKVMPQWSPHALTDYDSAASVTVYEYLLMQMHEQEFLTIITEDVL